MASHKVLLSLPFYNATVFLLFAQPNLWLKLTHLMAFGFLVFIYLLNFLEIKTFIARTFMVTLLSQKKASCMSTLL